MPLRRRRPSRESILTRLDAAVLAQRAITDELNLALADQHRAALELDQAVTELDQAVADLHRHHDEQ